MLYNIRVVLCDIGAVLSGFDRLANSVPFSTKMGRPLFIDAVFNNNRAIPLFFIADSTTMRNWRRRVLSWMSRHCSPTNILKGYYDAMVACNLYKQNWGMEW